MKSGSSSQRGELGLYLFQASTAILFIPPLVALWIFGGPGSGGQLPFLPPVLWVSTLALLMGDLTLGRGLAAVRRERQADFQQYLGAALLCGAAFLLLQLIGMGQLFGQFAAGGNTRFWGLLVILVALHGVHFLGGMFVLGYVAHLALRQRFDHEHHPAVRLTVIYWRFLDIVWLVVFAVVGHVLQQGTLAG